MTFHELLLTRLFPSEDTRRPVAAVVIAPADRLVVVKYRRRDGDHLDTVVDAIGSTEIEIDLMQEFVRMGRTAVRTAVTHEYPASLAVLGDVAGVLNLSGRFEWVRTERVPRRSIKPLHLLETAVEFLFDEQVMYPVDAAIEPRV